MFSVAQRKNMRYILADLAQNASEQEIKVEEVLAIPNDSDFGEVCDIQFEEVVDIDEIQKKLKQKINQENVSEELTDDEAEAAAEKVTNIEATDVVTTDIDEVKTIVSTEDEEIDELIIDDEDLDSEESNVEDGNLPEALNAAAPAVIIPKGEIVANAKKYVVYVDSDNIDFMESLSLNERRVIINKILREQNALGMKVKELNERAKFVRHAILATITFIIGFPILFFCVNKSTQAVIENYKDAKMSFSRLYKEQGKIKSIESKAAEKINY